MQTNAQDKGTTVTSLAISDFNSNSKLSSIVLNRSSIIVFDSTWLNQNDVKSTYDFLNATANKVGAFISIGESNYKLYEILDKASVYTLPQEENGAIRNPAGHNMPIVGFQLKMITDLDGSHDFVTGHFASGTTNSTLLQESIIDFLNHDGR
ncbi:MAG: hypothetical protein ACQCN3_08875 [Candidatus Bathyarchaeia archaeon]